jgi:hypothetical protein
MVMNLRLLFHTGNPLRAEPVLKNSDGLYCLKSVDCGLKDCYTAQFCLMYVCVCPLPDYGRMKSRNMSYKVILESSGVVFVWIRLLMTGL